ncbi:MAG: leucine-rich repeat domain-containing protein [Treponema sp.]|nr:leucine-rich repeat domain-containing protein [Treponema sp.]
MKKHSFVILSLIIPLLFTSCLAEFLNEKFGFNAPDPDDPKNLSKVHIYEYYFLDYEIETSGFVNRDSKKADIVSLSNTSFKPSEECENCQLIAEYKVDDTYENYYYEGKIYEKALVTQLFYYNPEISIDNFTNMIDLLPPLGTDYTWYIKLMDTSRQYFPSSLTVSSQSNNKRIYLDFTGCTALTDFTNSDGTFIDQTWLKGITLHIHTGPNTFNGCTSLEFVTLTDAVDSIGNYAFANCTALKEIIIPKDVTTISQGAFSGCTSLNNVILPNNLTTIGNSAFAHCKALKSIRLPNNVIKIDTNAFYNCVELESIKFPIGIQNISELAFEECINLQAIYLPKSSNLLINYGAFKNVPDNCVVYYQGSEDDWHDFTSSDNCRDDKIKTLPFETSYGTSDFWQ